MKSMKMIKRVQSGFTLIELMIVVAIIGILAAVAIPQYQDYVTRAKLAKAASYVDPIKLAIANYTQENSGTFSATVDDWTGYGLSAAPAVSTEVSAVSVTAGAIKITLAGIGGAYDGSTVTFSPTVNSTSLNWGVACSKAVANTTSKVFGC
jgi:type IV pilus assembly protein PilA